MGGRLIQFRQADGERGVALLSESGGARRLEGVSSVYGLAQRALQEGASLADLAEQLAGRSVDLGDVVLLAPIDHPDPAHLYLTGTGLTHLGSAEGRDKMHRTLAADAQPTDSMKMFLMGVEGGKPEAGAVGAQPEWFYKGNGSTLVGPGDPLRSPSFAGDAGEEPELAGVYIIDGQGAPVRLGFALANEFSDHVTERGNYLWLAHSKLRQAALGPELLMGDMPEQVHGSSRIIRNGEVLWEKPFVSGEANMSHSLANLEHHHFKYGLFRQPGDLHVHFFGTATLSFNDGISPMAGDIFEIEAAPFTLPVRNPLEFEASEGPQVRAL